MAGTLSAVRGRFRGSPRAVLATLALVSAAILQAVAVVPAPAQQTTPCDKESPGPYSVVSAPPKYAIGHQQIAQIPSAIDGATIQIGLLRPVVPAGVRVPVIVDASPYYNPLGTLNLVKCRPFLAHNFVPQGYAVALVPIRGTSDNGGCMELFGPKERADLNQAVTWLGTRSWSNGSVGMIGLSYDGSTPWEVASYGNPHLKTIVPEEGVTDIFNLMYAGGTLDWRAADVLSGIYYAESVALYARGRTLKHDVEVTACPTYATGAAAGLWSSKTGTEDPFGYWRARDYLDQIRANYRGSVLVSEGLQDTNVNATQPFPLVTELAQRGNYVEELIGQWPHAYPDELAPPEGRSDWANILLNWFDYWLKGDHALSLGPKIEIEDDHGAWRTSSAWPPVVPATRLWLTAGRRLATSASAQTATVTVAPDPVHLQDPTGDVNLPEETLAPICLQPVCAAFAMPAVSANYRITGFPRVRLTVTPTGPAGGVTVFLYDVGKQWRRVGWGQVDLRFPDGGRTRHAVQAGVPMTLAFRLQALDTVIAAGHHLVMVVTQANAYNRLPTVPAYPVRVAVGGQASSLSIQHVTPANSQFFVPPRLPECC
jgi:X-Pro dipeptidyl-peptidase